MGSESPTQRLAWNPEEDDALVQLVEKYGDKHWNHVAAGMPGRTGKACSHRWRTYLRPGCLHPHLEPFTDWETAVIFQAQKEHGNDWTAIAKLLLPGRSNTAVKNFWHCRLKSTSWRKHNKFITSNMSLEQLLRDVPHHHMTKQLSMSGAPSPTINHQMSLPASFSPRPTSLPHSNSANMYQQPSSLTVLAPGSRAHPTAAAATANRSPSDPLPATPANPSEELRRAAALYVAEQLRLAAAEEQAKTSVGSRSRRRSGSDTASRRTSSRRAAAKARGVKAEEQWEEEDEEEQDEEQEEEDDEEQEDIDMAAEQQAEQQEQKQQQEPGRHGQQGQQAWQEAMSDDSLDLDDIEDIECLLNAAHQEDTVSWAEPPSFPGSAPSVSALPAPGPAAVPGLPLASTCAAPQLPADMAGPARPAGSASVPGPNGTLDVAMSCDSIGTLVQQQQQQYQGQQPQQQELHLQLQSPNMQHPPHQQQQQQQQQQQHRQHSQQGSQHSLRCASPFASASNATHAASLSTCQPSSTTPSSAYLQQQCVQPCSHPPYQQQPPHQLQHMQQHNQPLPLLGQVSAGSEHQQARSARLLQQHQSLPATLHTQYSNQHSHLQPQYSSALPPTQPACPAFGYRSHPTGTSNALNLSPAMSGVAQDKIEAMLSDPSALHQHELLMQHISHQDYIGTLPAQQQQSAYSAPGLRGAVGSKGARHTLAYHEGLVSPASNGACSSDSTADIELPGLHELHGLGDDEGEWDALLEAIPAPAGGPADCAGPLLVPHWVG